jgi:hypothetical protein
VRLRHVGSSRGVVAFLGVVATGTAIALYAAPDVLFRSIRPAVDSTLTAFEPRDVVVLGAVCAGLVAFGRIVTAHRDPPTDERDTDSLTEATTDETVIGGRFDACVASTRVAIEDPVRRADTDAVRERIHGTAVDVLVAFEGWSREEATERIASGAWTDDEVAAAFLGGADAPPMPFLNRVYAWLYPAAAFERRVRRTVDEIHTRHGAATSHSLESAADTGIDAPTKRGGRG